jgi:hypothetical protein
MGGRITANFRLPQPSLPKTYFEHQNTQALGAENNADTPIILLCARNRFGKEPQIILLFFVDSIFEVCLYCKRI